MAAQETAITNVRIFDGFGMSGLTTVVMSDGRISDKPHAENVIDGKGGFLMPGLIDSHTHLNRKSNARKSVKAGVTSTFSIASADKVKQLPNSTRIFSTHGSALGSCTDAKAFVEQEAANGTAYVKIIVEHVPRMAKTTITQDVMNVIVEESHKRGLLVATHAVSVPTLQMAIDAGTDIYIHVPLEADMTPEMAEKIARQKAACVPTLVMMKGFADIPIYGYKKEDYRHAENNVRMLHEAGVPLLAGTDASNVIFLPWIRFGSDLHREMRLMAGAGLTPAEILTGATGLAAKVFGVDSIGTLEPGRHADMILIDGAPDRNIADTAQIRKVWIGGVEVFSAE